MVKSSVGKTNGLEIMNNEETNVEKSFPPKSELLEAVKSLLSKL